MNPMSNVSMNIKESSLFMSGLLPIMIESSSRAFGMMVGIIRLAMSPALLMPITPAILFDESAMLASSVEADQEVSQLSTGTSDGGSDVRYDFGMMSVRRSKNKSAFAFSSTFCREFEFVRVRIQIKDEPTATIWVDT